MGYFFEGKLGSKY